MAANLEAMSQQINSGQGPVGSLIYDKKLEQTFETGIANLERATVQLEQMMQKMNRDTDKLPEMLDDVQAVIDETRQTIEATQRIWPISSAIGQPEDKPLLVDPAPAND
jgi:ferritin-like metal-binding protein YciE